MHVQKCFSRGFYILFQAGIGPGTQAFCARIAVMAYQPKGSGRRPRNAHTQAQIRRDTLWQIAAPVAAAFLVAIVLIVLIILPGGAAVRSPVADVSLIFLILPAAILGLVMLVLLLGLNYGVFLGVTRLPPYFKLAQDFVAQVGNRVQGGAAKVSNVILKIRSFQAGARQALQDVRARLPFRRKD